MTVRYFDGFDIHRRILTGLDPGFQDTFQSWFGGGISIYDFPVGYNRGSSLSMATAGIKRAGFTDGQFPAFRMGFWSRSLTTGGSMKLVSSGSSTDPWSVQINTNGSLQLRRFNVNEGAATAGGVYDATWAHYEVFFDNPNGRAEVRKNGILILQATVAGDLTQNLIPNLGDWEAISVGWSPEYDHVYITDGPALTTNKIQGVSVVAAQDRYEGANGLRGTLMMGGNRYITPWENALVSSLSPMGGVFGKNVTNVSNFFFMTDPSSSQPWTESGLSSIESWGVCFQQFNSSTLGDRVRLAGALFSYLDYNDGFPLVKYYQAGAVTQFSGPWEKSHPDLSFSAHIVAVPREAQTEVADAKSLFIGQPGCILFQRLPDPVTPPPEMINVGITFAEEFREDYRDWVKVNGVGISFESMFSSGYSVLGEGNKKFQDNFVTVNYRNVPTGSCYIQGLWDYANSGDSGRWSMRQVIDNKGGDYTHGTRRLKIRGHGKAMQLRVTNKGDTPFVVNGWSMFITGNATV